jgi:alkylation response protein AidB-like acyl-CoA dehydrogenase
MTMLAERPATADGGLDGVLATMVAEAALIDREARFPHRHLKALAGLGLTGFTIPTRLGGAGEGILASCRLLGQLAAAEPSSTLVLAMTMIQQAIITQSERIPASMVERIGRAGVDGAFINALRVEPELGTPARGGLPATVARRTRHGWSIDGHKRFSTGAPILDLAIVFASTDEAEPRTGQFLVPMDAPGVRIVETWDHLGMRATGSHDMVMNGVEVPDDYALDLRLPSAWGFEPVQFAWVTLPLAALYDGIARGASSWLRGYLHERKPSGLGAPLATLPRMQSAIGEIEALLTVNRRLLETAAHEADQGIPPSVAELGLIKNTVSVNAIEAVQRAVALIGNPALDRKNPLERHLRDVLCARIHTPQEDSVFLAAGKAALGLA